jgi:hypothetical protein
LAIISSSAPERFSSATMRAKTGSVEDLGCFRREILVDVEFHGVRSVVVV